MSTDDGGARRAPSLPWLIAAALAALAASVAWALAPAYSSGATLAEENGNGVYTVLALPVIVAALPLTLALAGGIRRWFVVAATAVMGLFCLITGFTIGLCYVPSALLMIAAARAV